MVMRLSNRRVGKSAVAALLMAVVMLSGCPSTTAKKLSVAADAVAVGIDNAQDALIQGVKSGAISPVEASAVDAQLKVVAQAGLVLTKGIRENQSAKDVQGKLDSFINAFDALVNNGVAGIKNEQSKLVIDIALNGAKDAIATIIATLGGS